MRNLMKMFTAFLLSLYLPCSAFGAQAGIPCTGDDFPMYTWLAVMALALIALIAAVIYFCKSMKK